MGRTVHLVLSYPWYDEIESGMKKIEYRHNSFYWRKRLLEKPVDFVVFHRGYSKTTMKFKVKKIELGTISFDVLIMIFLGERCQPV